MVPLPDEVRRSHHYSMHVKCLSQQFKRVTKDFFCSIILLFLSHIKLQTVWLINAEQLWWESRILQEFCRPESSERRGIPMSRWKLSVFPCILTLWLSLHIPPLGELVLKKQGFPDDSVGIEPACNAGGPGSIPGSGRYAREEKGYPLQDSLGFPCGSAGKTWVWFLGWEEALEKGKASPVFFPGASPWT